MRVINIKCINNYLLKSYLTIGKLYNVELKENRGYTIIDDTGNLYVYCSDRFIIVDDLPVVSSFKILKAINSVGISKYKIISNNSKYVVIDETSTSYYVINDKGIKGKYPKANFQIIKG